MWPFASSSASGSGSSSSSGSAPPPPADESACPVDAQTRAAWLASNAQAPAAAGAAGVTPQQRSDFHSLSTQREVSSIPRFSRAGAPDAGGSEPDESRNWVYPSPAQFFAAMARKQQDPQAPDMDIVVPIHNAVNERAWRQICDWEAGWDASAQARCGGPQLVSFKNRQTERTWRAWARGLMGYAAPFDRHDWIVDRCGTRVRYIIDFYSGAPAADLAGAAAGTSARSPISFYLDVRPAPDLEGIKMRAHRLFLRPN